MAIQFRCPNEACGRQFTAKDEMAGRSGKCVACGTALVVPMPPAKPPAPDMADEFEFATAKAVPPTASKPIKPPPPDVDDFGAEAEIPSAPLGQVIRFGAIGLGWDLFRRKPELWIVTALVGGVCNVAANIGFGLLSIPFGLTEAIFLGALPFRITGLLTMFLGIAVQGVLIGGLFRMALEQVDGREIRLSDLFAVSGFAVRIALAVMLTTIGLYLGLLLLIIPGLIFLGVSMFVEPLVVDSGLGPVEALKESWDVLKREWWNAFLFHLSALGIMVSGVLLCGVGLLATIPFYVLSLTAQYRRVYAPGGKRRLRVIENPWALAVGQSEGARQVARVPGWAWALAALGLGTPVIVGVGALVMFIGLAYAASSKLQEAGNPTVFTKDAIGHRRFAARQAARLGGPGVPGLEPRLVVDSF